jgi:hypothetical protein
MRELDQSASDDVSIHGLVLKEVCKASFTWRLGKLVEGEISRMDL